MGHDRLLKEVLRGQLQAFLELFFPDVAARLDFGSVRFLDKEVFTDFPEGSVREVDVVVELATNEGGQDIILVHIEVQARPETDFAARMFEYYALLRLRHRVPVFPVVLYLRGGQGLSEEEYTETLFGREQIRFRYASVGLAKLEAEEYLENGPLGAALAALMSRAQVPDRVELRAAMLRRIIRSGLDDAQKFLLVNVVETYFELDEEETERFRQFLTAKGYREVEEMEVTWADKMMEKGREKGREEGREEGREQGLKAGVIEGKRETLLRQLTAKFGPVSEEMRSLVRALESADELDRYLERVLTAKSIEEMGLGT